MATTATITVGFPNADAMIVERVNAGHKRAKVAGKVLGRPRIDAGTEADIRAALAKGGKGILKIAAEYGVADGGIIYNVATGTLCTTSTAPRQGGLIFAKVSPGLALTTSDFTIV